jgi:hypothetical protein
MYTVWCMIWYLDDDDDFYYGDDGDDDDDDDDDCKGGATSRSDGTCIMYVCVCGTPCMLVLNFE